MGIRIGSQEELDSQGGEFTLLPEDTYIVEVREITIKSQPNPYNNNKPRDVALVKMNVISFENGEPLYDVDGNDTSDRLFFDFLEIERLGFNSAGKASKARQFIAACLNQPVADAIEFDSWDDLLGKRIIAQAVHRKNGRQGVEAYRPPRRGRPQSSRKPEALPGENIAKAEEKPAEDLTDKAKEIFGEDAEF